MSMIDMMEEAEEWCVRLDLDEAEGSCVNRPAFERWRAVPAHAVAYEEARRRWLGFDRLSGHARLEQLAARAWVETGSRHWSAREWRWGGALAASLAVCALAGAAFHVGQHYTPTDTYTTGAGQRSTIELEDGSQVALNVATRLDVSFSNGRRDLTLKAGEAVFTVAEDPRRPFRVLAGKGEVTALGTRFQVRNESKQVTVTLLEGKVAVDHRQTQQHMQLNPGDQVMFTAAVPDMTRRVVDPAVVSSWMTGRLKFKATPLSEVLEEVNRYSKTRIRLLDAPLGRIPLTGTFEIGDVASVVLALEGMLPLEVRRKDEGEILLSRK